jgi:hypothetical protein
VDEYRYALSDLRSHPRLNGQRDRAVIAPTIVGVPSGSAAKVGRKDPEIVSWT